MEKELSLTKHQLHLSHSNCLFTLFSQVKSVKSPSSCFLDFITSKNSLSFPSISPSPLCTSLLLSLLYLISSVSSSPKCLLLFSYFFFPHSLYMISPLLPTRPLSFYHSICYVSLSSSLSPCSPASLSPCFLVPLATCCISYSWSLALLLIINSPVLLSHFHA